MRIERRLQIPPSAHLVIGVCLEQTITENPLLVSPSSFLFILIIFILQILPEGFARQTRLKKKKMFETVKVHCFRIDQALN